MANRLEVLPLSGCVVHPFQGAIPAHCIHCRRWQLDGGDGPSRHGTPNNLGGEGHGAAQETETRHCHPSCLAVVLLHDGVRHVMALLAAIV